MKIVANKHIQTCNWFHFYFEGSLLWRSISQVFLGLQKSYNMLENRQNLKFLGVSLVFEFWPFLQVLRPSKAKRSFFCGHPVVSFILSQMFFSKSPRQYNWKLHHFKRRYHFYRLRNIMIIEGWRGSTSRQLQFKWQSYGCMLHAVKNNLKSVFQILRDKSMEINNTKERRQKRKNEVENIVDIIILPSIGKGKLYVNI